jgi:beta-xylosidase
LPKDILSKVYLKTAFMKVKNLLIIILSLFSGNLLVAQQQAQNPIIHADVPDMSMIRVGNDYYMSSTTMHMSPGVPIMKSTDLVNWKIVNYAYDTLGDEDALELENGQNAYGAGSWASSLRYHDGTFYVSTFASTTGKTHIFKTKDIENGPGKKSLLPLLITTTPYFLMMTGRSTSSGVGEI